MGEIGDFWRDVNQARKKRQNNHESALKLLKENNIEFESKNNGLHLIIHGRNCRIDFWPTTGKYITKDGNSGRGVFNLIKLLS